MAGDPDVLLRLVEAQAAQRARSTATAKAGATRAFAKLDRDDWWNPAKTKAATRDALKVVQPAQRAAARSASAFLARAASEMTGKTVTPAGAVDVTRLRKKMSRQVAEALVRGDVEPAYVVLGDLHDGPGDDIDTPITLAVPDPNESVIDRLRRLRDERARAAAHAEVLDPGDAYGRAADVFRREVDEGKTEDQARVKALLRISAVAETDVTLAVRQQWIASGKKIPGIRGYRRVLHPEQSKDGPCGLCVVAADRIYHVSELEAIHARCVPAGTRVAAEGVLAVTRRSYTGVLVVIRTASGHEVTVTANHPVLTDQGWIPAHLVNERHHLVRHRAGHGVAGRSPHEGDGPPLVEDVWRAALVSGALYRRVMPVAAEDFHGDGSHGEVEIVSTDRYLPRIGDVSFGKPRSELALVAGERLGIGLTADGLAGQQVFGDRLSANGFVRGRGDGFALFGRGRGVEDSDGLGLATWFDAALRESETNHGALHAVLLGEAEFRGASSVLLDDFLIGQDLPDAPRFDPAGFEFAGEGRHAYAQLGRDLRDWLAGDVELDRVVDQRRVEGTHEVFNLQTVGGWFSADGYVVSNCVCEVLPIIGEMDPGVRLNADDLEAIYRAAGGVGGEKVITVGGKRKHVSPGLKKVRVALAEHAELGPVLVDANQHYRGPREVAETLLRHAADEAA